MKDHPNFEKAVELWRLILTAAKEVDHTKYASLLIFAKQCSLASQEIERLLNETTPTAVKPIK